jgi:hypothetical protein
MATTKKALAARPATAVGRPNQTIPEARSRLRREPDSLVDPRYWKRRQEVEGDRAPQLGRSR